MKNTFKSFARSILLLFCVAVFVNGYAFAQACQPPLFQGLASMTPPHAVNNCTDQGWADSVFGSNFSHLFRAELFTAARLPVLLGHVGGVVGSRARKQMIGPSTRRIVAFVANKSFSGDRAVGQNVGKAMREDIALSSADANNTIPFRIGCPLPFPASVGFNNTLLEPLFNWSLKPSLPAVSTTEPAGSIPDFSWCFGKSSAAEFASEREAWYISDGHLEKYPFDLARSTEARQRLSAPLNSATLYHGNQQGSCIPPIFGGWVNSCSGLSVRWLNRNPVAQIARFETRWHADGIIQTLPGGALSASRQTGCNFSSQVTITQFLKTGASCAVSSTGSAPHSFPCSLCQPQNQGGQITVVSAANYRDTITADSFAAAFADGDVTNVTAAAPAFPLPLELAGVRADLDGASIPLTFVSPRQVNLYVPASVSPGQRTLRLTTADSRVFTGLMTIVENAPALFTFSNTGVGAAAAFYLDLGGLVFAGLYGTGVSVRINTSTGEATGTVKLVLGDGQEFAAQYSGPAPPPIRAWQFNFGLPASVFSGAPPAAKLRVCVPDGRCWESQTVTLRR